MQCLTTNDIFELARVEKEITLSKCIESEPMVNKKRNQKNLVKAIYMLIKRFNELINVGKPMNDNQMVVLASDLLERFGSESLEDVALFFKMARQGEFGKIQRLDSITVFSWIPKYLDAKAEIRERKIMNEKNERQREESEIIPHPEAMKKLEKLSQSLKTKSKEVSEKPKNHGMFNYSDYLKELAERCVSWKTDKVRQQLMNTSKVSYPEVYEILANEIKRRND